MQSVKFPGANIEIGKGQPEYNVLHAMQVPSQEGEVIMCFEFTDEEIERLKETKRIYYKRWTFGHSFQPMKLQIELDDDIQLT